MISAVLFDVDGTLIDTTEYIYQAFEHSLDLHNYDLLPRSEMKKMIGQTLEDCYHEFAQIVDVEQLMDTHHEYQIENPHLAIVYPNSLGTLEKLREKGILIAVVTSRARETAIETLEHLDLLPHIDYVVGLEDVKNAKPDPEGINKALNFLGVHPADSMMVGDSDVDVAAGKNAGTMTVGVMYGFHGDDIISSEPDHVIDDIIEVVDLLE